MEQPNPKNLPPPKEEENKEGQEGDEVEGGGD